MSTAGFLPTFFALSPASRWSEELMLIFVLQQLVCPIVNIIQATFSPSSPFLYDGLLLSSIFTKGFFLHRHLSPCHIPCPKAQSSFQGSLQIFCIHQNSYEKAFSPSCTTLLQITASKLQTFHFNSQTFRGQRAWDFGSKHVSA